MKWTVARKKSWRNPFSLSKILLQLLLFYLDKCYCFGLEIKDWHSVLCKALDISFYVKSIRQR